jgi:hypothetical protein
MRYSSHQNNNSGDDGIHQLTRRESYPNLVMYLDNICNKFIILMRIFTYRARHIIIWLIIIMITILTGMVTCKI